MDRAKCIGCGVCVIGYATDAIETVPVGVAIWLPVKWLLDALTAGPAISGRMNGETQL